MNNLLPDHLDIIDVITVPPFIVALHRLNRLGKATKYLGSKHKFVLFDLNTPEGEVLKEKWLPLRDANSIAFIYTDPEGISKCL